MNADTFDPFLKCLQAERGTFLKKIAMSLSTDIFDLLRGANFDVAFHFESMDENSLLALEHDGQSLVVSCSEAARVDISCWQQIANWSILE